MIAETDIQPDSTMKGETIEISAARRFFWAVRRELWEYRSIYIAPLAAAGVALIGFVASAIHEQLGNEALPTDPTKLREAIAGPYDAAMALILGTALITAAYYCLETMHGERRDRSILFWKSLPVSDVSTVMAKATIVGGVIWVVSCAIGFVTQLVMLLLDSAINAAAGRSVAILWHEVAPFRASVDMLYHVLTVHVLWWAPFYGWLMLVSAWARWAPLLWATLPPLAIGGIEKIVFGSKHFFDLLLYRLQGPSLHDVPSQAIPMIPMVNLANFLSIPGLWLGLAFAAGCLALAVRLRRYREPV